MTCCPRLDVKRVSALLGIPALLLCIDLFFRFDYIAGLPLRNAKYIVMSSLFEALTFATLLLAISRARPKLGVSIVFGVTTAALLTLIYGHFAYFKVLPNVFSIGFLVDNIENTLVIVSDTVTWQHVLGLLTGGAILSWLMWLSLRYAPQTSWKSIAIALLIIIGCGLVINNNVRFHPSSFTGLTNTLFSAKYFVQKRYLDADFTLRNGNMQRTFTLLEHKVSRSSLNCLLIVGESVRRRQLSYYGYERQTAPFVSSLLDDGRTVAFKRHYANSNSTDFSLPMIMSGVFAIEKLRVPYVYDYLKAWAGVHTFFYSAQSLRKSNQDVVYGTKLDAFVYQENSGLPRYCDLGADDYGVLELLDRHLAKIEGQFFGIVQLNNTHYPYMSKAEHKRFLPAESKTLNAYDNSILETDALVQAYFDVLRRHGRLDNTLVIFLSDHGEAFDDHGHSGHLQTLYDEEIAVPLWVFVPQALPEQWLAALRANANKETSHLDLLPTILDAFACLEHTKMSPQVVGSSLLRPLEASRAIPLVSASLMPMNGYIRNGNKFLHRGEGRERSYELYDLATDPDEVRNLWTGLADNERMELKNTLATCQPLTHSRHTPTSFAQAIP
jgi:glucan phosphoethanolaminetransferase (alkaline phosphatase superfamily)